MSGQAQTPGQAAMMPGQAYWEAYVIARDGELDSDPEDISRWENLPEDLRGWIGTGVQAAIDVFLAGDSVSAGTIREALAARERPAPTRADEFARMKVKLSALVASMEDTVRPRENCELDDYAMSREFDDGAVHATAVTLRQLRDILDETALTAGQPQPAPGDELAMLRADLADAEALIAKWPRCPAGCSCRIGIEDDADRNECGCDGPCNGEPQPAPELAAVLADRHDLGALNAWQGAEISRLREQLAAARATIGELAQAAVDSAEISDLRKRLDERNAQHKKLLDGFDLVEGIEGDQHGVSVLDAAELARAYRDAGYPVRDDLSHLATEA